jgi:hypothetical protein
MDILGIVVLVLATCASLFAAPEFGPADLIEPTIQAAVTTPVVLSALVVGRLAGWPTRVERALLAAFLALMPTVYLLSLALHGAGAPWPLVEIAGQVLFAAVAIVGWRRSGYVLAAGIVAHGLLWDSWHYGATTFMPSWYAVGCLIVDVGWGFYAFTRVPVWEADARRAVDGARTSPIGRVAPAR